MTAMRLTGYSDKFSVHPGDTIKFYVNCAGPAEYSAEIVHLIHGDTNPRGPGVIEPSVLADVNKTYKVAARSSTAGHTAMWPIPRYSTPTASPCSAGSGLPPPRPTRATGSTAPRAL